MSICRCSQKDVAAHSALLGAPRAKSRDAEICEEEKAKVITKQPINKNPLSKLSPPVSTPLKGGDGPSLKNGSLPSTDLCYDLGTVRCKILAELYEKYIYGTPPKIVVVDKPAFLCRLTWAVAKAIGTTTMKVYVSTRMLKHLYDSRPAEEFVFIIENLHTIVKYPDKIYGNKVGKRGDFCFVKELKGERYIASIELTKQEDEKIFVATAFRLRKKSYLNNYKPLWSWRDDHPSS